MKKWSEIWIFVRPFVLLAVPLFLSSLATWFLTRRHFRKKNRHEFLSQRLEKLYGPLFGLIKQVDAIAARKPEREGKLDKAWRETCDLSEKPFVDHDKHFKPFAKHHAYENERFRREDLPAYKKMLSLLRTENHLAYESTLKWMDTLIQYIDQWERPIPQLALQDLSVPELMLVDFYRDVERQYNALKRNVSGDKNYVPDTCTTRFSNVA